MLAEDGLQAPSSFERHLRRMTYSFCSSVDRVVNVSLAVLPRSYACRAFCLYRYSGWPHHHDSLYTIPETSLWYSDGLVIRNVERGGSDVEPLRTLL
jgi:hypothetical protein